MIGSQKGEERLFALRPEPEGRGAGGAHGTYSRLSSRYSAAEMAKAIEASLDIFVRKVAPESAIRSMKIWEADEIRFSINYENNGSKQEFMTCHYHGGSTMDCHRKGNAGPGEPDKK